VQIGGTYVAAVAKKRNADGSTSYVAQVRLKGFKPRAKSFVKRSQADAWADQLERTLISQRERGGVRADVATMTVGDLLLEFARDAEVTKLRTFDDLHRLCAWWIQSYGGTRAVEFNVLSIREAREKLAAGRGPATVATGRNARAN
jgi:hypothetical protein